MNQLRADMRKLGYLHLDMASLELPQGLLPKGREKDTIKNAHIFSKENRADAAPEEVGNVQTVLEAFARRNSGKKTITFYPHPRQDAATARTWVVLTE